MTRLRIACLLVAVAAGDYAALSLIQGQLAEFGLAAAVCAASSVAAGLIAFADDESARRRHEQYRRSRAAQQSQRSAPQSVAAPAARSPQCHDLHQGRTDSPRFADRQAARPATDCTPGGIENPDRPVSRIGTPPNWKPRKRNRVRRCQIADDPGMTVRT
jgi:hypothetical protein